MKNELPRIGTREEVHRNPFHSIYRVTASFADFQKQYYVNSYGAKVGVLVERDGEVLFVRQYRFLINGYALEIPGGKIEDQEEPKNAAARELKEETGLISHDLRPLIFTHPGLDNFENPTHLFFTSNVRSTESASVNRQEIAESIWIPTDQAIAMAFAGEIVDSMTILALLARQVRSAPQFEDGTR